MNDGNKKIIGYDQTTGQPIFDSGIDKPINEEPDKKIEKKVLTKGKLIFHIVLSYLVWNLIIGFGYSTLGTAVFSALKNVNTILYLVLFNFLWIIRSVLTIFLTYWFNKFNTCEEYQLRSVRSICLFIFLIEFIGVNFNSVETILDYFPIVGVIMIVLHIIIIWFYNDKMFNKWIDDIDGKF